MTSNGRITSRRHPLVQRLRAAARRESQEALLDGPHLLAEALRSQAAAGDGRSRLLAVVVTHGAIDTPEIDALCDEAVRQEVPVQIVPDALADAISPAVSPSGVVALAEVALADVDAVLGLDEAGVARLGTPVVPLVVVLAGVQDPGNVGTIVRTAEAAGATGIVLLEGTADPLGWKAMRGSMGSALRLPLHRSVNGTGTLAELRTRGVQLVAADNNAAGREDVPDVTRPTALLVGAEGPGLPAMVLSQADATIRIPVSSPVESLNVAVATALLLFEVRRVRGGPGILHP